MKKFIHLSILLILFSCNSENSVPDDVISNVVVDTIKTDGELQFTIEAKFKPTEKTVVLNPTKDTVVHIGERGTRLIIPKNIFVYENGEKVQEEVVLSFVEYTNPAEMLFSQIPMTYEYDQEKFFFNSAGMFDINAKSQNEVIQIAQGEKIEIDYALVTENDDIDFYRLNEDSTNWELIQEIDQQQELGEVTETIRTIEKVESNIDFDSILTSEIRKIQPNTDDIHLVDQKIDRYAYSYKDTVIESGNEYSGIIRALAINRFGIYNCDQLIRLPNKIVINPDFVDQDGNVIKGVFNVSLVDLNYNSVFSFPPSKFVCSSNGANVLFVYTRDHEIFAIKSTAFKALNINSSGSYQIPLEDMTDRFLNTTDVMNYMRE